MSAKTNDEKPATEYPSLAAALAAFQRSLPSVDKSAKGQVRGNPNYKYADLADLNGAVLPELGKFGLSFSCKPTLNAQGRFVLAYALRHESGQGDETGEYPLREDVAPQDQGSWQTYARRYILQAITGVAPQGQDDDGAAAQRSYEQRGQARQEPPARPQPPAQDPQNGMPTVSAADHARDALRAHCAKQGYDMAKVAEKYASMHEGRTLKTEDEAVRITAFTKLLDGMPETELRLVVATNGAAQ